MKTRLVKLNDSKLSRLTKYSSTVFGKKQNNMENKISLMYVTYFVRTAFFPHLYRSWDQLFEQCVDIYKTNP